MEWILDPTAWLGLLTLIVLEIVLGIDNLVFIAILSNKLPVHQQQKARRIGLSLALGMRIGLLLLIGWIVTLQTPLFDLGIRGAPGAHGEPGFETACSGRDLILLAGGLFLLWKATSEIHHSMDPEAESGELLDKDKNTAPGAGAVAQLTFSSAIAQIIALDLVFSLDSVITAVGMVEQIPIMVAAMIISVVVMLAFAGRIGEFVQRHPSMKILALSFLLLIGVLLVAEGMGQHISKGYVYFAMAFSLVVELLNMRLRRRRAAPVALHARGPR